MRGYQRNKQLNNKGFTMIELLVVIVLMAALVGLATYSITVMRSGDTKKASKTMSGELAALRSNTLAIAGDWQYEIVNNDGKYMLYTYKDGNLYDVTSVGSRIKIYYKSSETAEEKELTKDNKIIVKFVQGSGKVGGLYTATSVDMNSATDVSLATSIKSTGCCIFKMTNNRGTGVEDFRLYYETGAIVQD